MLPVRIRRLVALLSIAAAALAPVPAAALADTGTSAGDQQYVDPLNPNSTTPATHGSGSGTASSGSSSASAPASSGSSASSGSTVASSSSLPAAGTSPTTGTSTGRTLPFTGYDGGLAAALGAGLVAGGVLLRRRLAAAGR